MQPISETYNNKSYNMKKIVLLVSVLASISTGMAQSLDKMQWFNEPESWEIKDNVLTMDVTPKATSGVSHTMALRWMTVPCSIRHAVANLRRR